MTHPDYWVGRWKRGETGWHQDEPEPKLVAYFKGLSPRRVFVPLCGKSLDLKWLASQGHSVIGVEFSPLACEAFFSENQIPFSKTQKGGFTVFENSQIQIFSGDFFELSPSLLGKIDAVYDRAALIALPQEMRQKYTSHLIELIQNGVDPHRRGEFKFLQLILERIPSDLNGPPFSVSSQELKSLYEKTFKIEEINREEIDEEKWAPSKVYENTYTLNLAH